MLEFILAFVIFVFGFLAGWFWCLAVLNYIVDKNK